MRNEMQINVAIYDILNEIDQNHLVSADVMIEQLEQYDGLNLRDYDQIFMIKRYLKQKYDEITVVSVKGVQ